MGKWYLIAKLVIMGMLFLPGMEIAMWSAMAELLVIIGAGFSRLIMFAADETSAGHVVKDWRQVTRLCRKT